MPDSQRCGIHPENYATGRCRQCGQAVCNACKIQTDVGVFCSMRCGEQMAQFHEEMACATPVFRRGFDVKKFVNRLIFLMALCLVFYAVMYYRYGMTDPMAMLAYMRDVIRGAFETVF